MWEKQGIYFVNPSTFQANLVLNSHGAEFFIEVAKIRISFCIGGMFHLQKGVFVTEEHLAEVLQFVRHYALIIEISPNSKDPCLVDERFVSEGRPYFNLVCDSS